MECSTILHVRKATSSEDVNLRNRVIHVADVSQGVGLLHHGIHPIGVPVPERIHRDPGAQVQVLSPLDVVQFTPPAAGEHDGSPRVRAHEDLTFRLHHLLALVTEPYIPWRSRLLHLQVQARRDSGAAGELDERRRSYPDGVASPAEIGGLESRLAEGDAGGAHGFLALQSSKIGKRAKPRIAADCRRKLPRRVSGEAGHGG